jgi:8-oxo-dGTP diphosphatase
VFVLLERDGKAFFLRRANTGWADGRLTLPSGHVDKGDLVREAAVKEAKEEAGVEVNPEDLEFMHVDYIRDVYINFYFKATKWKGEPKLGEPHLASEVVWVDTNNLPGEVITQLKNMFRHYRNKSYFSEIEDEE